ATNDLNPGPLAHYGPPLVSAANTVIVPVKTGTNGGFRIDAFDGTTTNAKYTLTTDYILPAFQWVPSYNPCIVTGSFGTRLYYPGAGGTILHVDNPDSNTPGAPVREVFYTSLANYNANAAAFNATVFVDTPITADSAGNIYFGFRVQGSAPAPLSTTQSGYARIDKNGVGSFVLAANAANDANATQTSVNAAPALSNDESTLYVVVKTTTQTGGHLLGLDSTTLATKYNVLLRDPRSVAFAQINDLSTSSPMVGPDGDVYYGVLGNPANGSRGFLLHFSADLSVVKTPGGFGWDYTPGIVPANLVPSYTGTSPYLLFCKYNDYAIADGSGVNKVAILDPNDTQIDPHFSAPGLVEMREVLTINGATPDSEFPAVPNAVKEWCINASAVNPATKSVFFDSEDGHLYRWNLATNSLDQAIILNPGVGQPYVPTVIGPDGTVYTLNGGNFFAVGRKEEVEVTISSSSPDLRDTVFGTSITFTANVTGTGPAPTGTVSFADTTYNGFTPVTTTLANNVPLDANGHASVTTSALTAGGAFLGNHFIIAIYNGDGSHASTFATLMQKVHANASTTSVSGSPNPASFGQAVTFFATVTPAPGGTGVPTGMVTFLDGTKVIGQAAVNGTGIATITTSSLGVGSHTINASYVSDTRFARSSGSTSQVIQGPSVQFSQPGFSVNEGAGSVTLTVTRIGDASNSASVDYKTSDNDTFTVGCSDTVGNLGNAFGRCDFATTVDTLTFAAGETSKSFQVPIIDDAIAEGNETFSVILSNPIGATLGTPTTVTVTINDNDTVTGSNPIFTTPFFVRQHYLDFLSREPEVGEPWTAVLNNCSDVNNNPACDRLTVSGAFFGSPEFQLKGYFVYRFYKLAFNRLPLYSEIVVDMRSVTGQTPAEVFQKKGAFTKTFVQRAEFTAAYTTLSNADYVANLMNRYGLTQITTPDPANPDGQTKVTFSSTELTNRLNGVGGILTRAQVLRAIADSDQVFNLELNKAFVAMQYFGYLRRTPEQAGYDSWLNYLNTHPGDSRTMVNGFMNSAEYRLRFGPAQ
ncbi:MAG TPA: Ig-like domain repeat protein, partial [Pyrinomonadaceae bacterium]|nr:Ig-like domain repeat protein [Pyrinomonadaceae bacterium]